ncbi:alpha amylase [Coprinopsis cinerea okayama7|uniref:Alpha amylase n=1 Tax=Coprinopsis cinerea (strain Okayama-7 / 130 / ATCC MYA-4618 / FGSC 9003) TaxID=240176 RepID=A8NCS8_COPC7|nr:alpha amylase [Coprinopsis cinerea okayama7\|eukprot:XP_001832618.2 alpha amylase [Coprinopsis cinerea okayama7\
MFSPKLEVEVSLINHSYDNDVLSGTINVQNIAYSKVVVVHWASGDTWSDSQTIAATYSSSGSNNFETWSFSGRAPGATQFYIRYVVSGQTYYDPGNYQNHQISRPPGGGNPSPPGPAPTGPANLPAILPSNVPYEAPANPPSGCSNFNGWDNCNGGNTEMVASSERRRWQTPPRGDPAYFESFQDYSHLVGYANIQYNSGRTSAVVTVNAVHKEGAELTYSFNGVEQSSPSFEVDSSLQGTLAITVTSSDGKKLVLEPLNFFWQHQSLSAAQSNFNNGQKGGIVELFGWPWKDIEKECEFLGKAGYMGVKVWPPTEHVWGSHHYEPDTQFRPWYQVGRNATDYSPYYTNGNTYLINPFTGTRPTLEFPAVPFGPTDFHCERGIDDWNNGFLITRGWLVGLTDLNTAKPYVQDRIATFLVDLISIGFSGFRVDAAKHIGPNEMAQILGRVKNKLGGSLPADFLTWMEVIIGGETQLNACGGGEYSWYTNFDNRLRANGFGNDDIQKVKIWSSDYPASMPICGHWILPPSRFAVQNDDHDQQHEGSSPRWMGDKGSVLIKDKNVGAHRHFSVNLFSRRDHDWHIKLLLSSYMFSHEGGNGFPDGLSDCNTHYTGTLPRSGCRGIGFDQAYVANACGYTMVPGKYTRPHRDISIINAMRGWVGLPPTNAHDLGIPGCH